ncbi:hypothetical protein [Erwinia psidii]|nr:hypothetical protein [Erwinia psidii]
MSWSDSGRMASSSCDNSENPPHAFPADGSGMKVKIRPTPSRLMVQE